MSKDYGSYGHRSGSSHRHKEYSPYQQHQGTQRPSSAGVSRTRRSSSGATGGNAMNYARATQGHGQHGMNYMQTPVINTALLGMGEEDWPKTGNYHVLVAGGAGYIASHTVVCLLEQGYDVTIVDNYVNSNVESIKRVRELTNTNEGTEAAKRVRVFECDMCDASALEKVFKESPKFDAAIQFAGLKAVGESVAKPLLYYQNNLVSTFNLLQMMVLL